MKNFTKRVKALDANLMVPQGTPKLASTHPSFIHGGTGAPMHLTYHCAHTSTGFADCWKWRLVTIMDTCSTKDDIQCTVNVAMSHYQGDHSFCPPHKTTSYMPPCHHKHAMHNSSFTHQLTHVPPCSKTRPIKNKDQVEAMKELWSELVDYHDFYLPGVTTNCHSYTNQPTYCLLPIYLHKMTYTLAPSRVHAKWTGSKIIKYSGEAFRLWTCLSILKEACPLFCLHLLTLLNQTYSSSLALQHHSWDMTQDKAREW
jgi:hypothetical protein